MLKIIIKNILQLLKKKFYHMSTKIKLGLKLIRIWSFYCTIFPRIQIEW